MWGKVMQQIYKYISTESKKFLKIPSWKIIMTTIMDYLKK